MSVETHENKDYSNMINGECTQSRLEFYNSNPAGRMVATHKIPGDEMQ